MTPLATATSNYGVAFLDLSGNYIVWSASDTSHRHILLDGSRFHDTVRMTTLAISALCLLSFFTITMAVCCVSCSSGHASKYLPWGTVWIPIFCMIGHDSS